MRGLIAKWKNLESFWYNGVSLVHWWNQKRVLAPFLTFRWMWFPILVSIFTILNHGDFELICLHFDGIAPGEITTYLLSMGLLQSWLGSLCYLQIHLLIRVSFENFTLSIPSPPASLGLVMKSHLTRWDPSLSSEPTHKKFLIFSLNYLTNWHLERRTNISSRLVNY